MKTAPTERYWSNELRTNVEAAFKSAGLVEVAGGTRYTYFGLARHGKLGLCVRVGAKAWRLVKRWQGLRGITDTATDKERYHGQYPAEKLGHFAHQAFQLIDSK